MPATQSRGHAAPHRILHAIALAVMVAASAVAPVAASTASPVALRAQGSDPAPSSVKACSRSIQSRIDAAAAGSTVTVPACLARERIRITKPLTLVGTPGAEIRGSDVWTGWTRKGNTWVSKKHVPSFYNPGGTCNAGTSRCHWPEQVFVNGRPLVQVSSSTTPHSGQFRITASRLVVIGTSPYRKTVEVTVRDNVLWIGASDVTVRGFRLRHAATAGQGGLVTIGGYWVGPVDRATLANNVISDAHGRDITIEGGTGHRILKNSVTRAGNVGIGGGHGTNWTISGNTIAQNATEGFHVGTESGGMKLVDVDGLLVENNVASYNSRGLWTDTGVRNATFRNNRLDHNGYQGLLLEAASHVTVTGNSAWENGWGPGGAAYGWGGAIVLSSGDHAEIADNVVAWNADGITVISQARGDDNDHVDINVHDNAIMMRPRSVDTNAYASGFLMDWSGILFDPASNNRGSGNRYWYPSGENGRTRFAWNGPLSRLGAFAATPAESTTTYLTSAQKDAILGRARIPTSAVRR